MNIQAWPGVLGVPGPEGKRDDSLPFYGEQGGPDRWHRVLEIPSTNYKVQSSELTQTQEEDEMPHLPGCSAPLPNP